MRFGSTSLVATVLLLASHRGPVTAQSISSLSSSCQAAATSLITSPLSSCINLIALVQVLSATGSVVQPLDSWLGGACAQDCSASTLQNATSTIQSGCSSDIQSGNAVAEGLLILTTNYTQVKNVLCLDAKSNNTFCLTNLLTGVQNATGSDITTSTVTNLITGGVSGFETLFQSLPTSVLCTDCTHAEISTLSQLFSSVSGTSTSSAFAAVGSTCGASFIDGSIPSTVGERTSGSSTSSGTSSATSPAGTSKTDGSAAGRAISGVSGTLVAACAGALSLTLLGAWTTLA